MKAEERHELRENDLAGWLQYGLWAFLKQNGSYLLLIAALAFLGYRLWVWNQEKKEVARNTAFYSLETALAAENPLIALEDLAKSSDIQAVKAQASLLLGQLYEGLPITRKTLDSRGMSRDEALSKAYEHYSNALKLQGDDALIAFKARLGVAAVYEDKSEWAKAQAEYEGIIKEERFAGACAALAKGKLDTLKQRREAPRLAAMTEAPVKVSPSLPNLPLPGSSGMGGLLTPSGNSMFPDLFGPTTKPATGPEVSPPIFGPPAAPAATVPSTFNAPSMPDISPAVPATAPN